MAAATSLQSTTFKLNSPFPHPSQTKHLSTNHHHPPSNLSLPRVFPSLSLLCHAGVPNNFHAPISSNTDGKKLWRDDGEDDDSGKVEYLDDDAIKDLYKDLEADFERAQTIQEEFEHLSSQDWQIIQEKLYGKAAQYVIQEEKKKKERQVGGAEQVDDDDDDDE